MRSRGESECFSAERVALVAMEMAVVVTVTAVLAVVAVMAAEVERAEQEAVPPRKPAAR